MSGVTEKSSYAKSSKDNVDIFARVWSVDRPKAVIVIFHGMSEHSGRYRDFARALASELNVLCISADHRAHGLTSCPQPDKDLSNLGTFTTNKPISSIDCLEYMASDTLDVINSCGADSSLPIFLFGHSMGSLIARVSLRDAPTSIRDRIKGVVLSGVPTVPAVYERFPLLVLVKSALWIGRGRDTLHHFIMDKFDNATRKLKHDKSLPRGCFITSVRSEVDAFNSDPLCGQTVDLNVWKSIRSTLISLMKPQNFFTSWTDSSRKPPILFISGKDDPVCLGGKTASSDATSMKRIGFETSEIVLESCLHEFIHETTDIRQKGMAETISWFRSKL